MKLSRRGCGHLVAIVAMFCSGVPGASAYDVTAAPTAKVEMRLDDNIRGRSDEPESAWGFDTSAGVEVAAASETYRSMIYPRVNVRRFVTGKNLDTEEYFVDFENELIRESVVSRLDFSFRHDSTLATEATDIGLLDQVRDRELILINPSMDWRILEHWVLQTNFSYSDVKYIDAENTGLIDYRYLSGSVGFYHEVSDTAQAFGTFFVSDFSTPDLGGSTRNYGVQSGLTKKMSKNLDVTASVGRIWSEIEFRERQLRLVFDPFPRFVPVFSTGQEASSGTIAALSLEQRFRDVVLDFDYSRQVSPTGRGAQGTTDEILMRVARQLSPRLTVVAIGKHEIRTTEGDLNNFALDRDLTSATGELHYKLTETLTFVGRYRFRFRKSTQDENNPITSAENAIFLAVKYSGNPRNLLNGF